MTPFSIMTLNMKTLNIMAWFSTLSITSLIIDCHCAECHVFIVILIEIKLWRHNECHSYAECYKAEMSSCWLSFRITIWSVSINRMTLCWLLLCWNVIMQSVAFLLQCWCHYAAYHYAECVILKCRYADCRYAECYKAEMSSCWLSFWITLWLVSLNQITLCWVLLYWNVIIQSVIMQSVAFYCNVNVTMLTTIVRSALY